MKDPRRSVLLATDGQLLAQMRPLSDALGRVCKYLRFSSLEVPVNLGPGPISYPDTYRLISHATSPLLQKHSLVLIGTELPYDNNYFWQSDSNVIIASCWGWDALTNLPRHNGIVGLVATILAKDLDPDCNHDENTGCIFDFLWDKSGLDARLRFGAICRDCYRRLREQADAHPGRRLRYFDCCVSEGLEDLGTILDELSQSSRREVDVLDRWKTKAGVPQDFDVFLCHNSQDKPSVRRLFEQLRERGMNPWFDEEHLPPGRPWQSELEEMIPRIRAAAVVVGPNGRGPWQEVELSAFLREFIRRGCPVIPVLLKDAGATPLLPLFLQAFTWVDFRRSPPDPWRQLIWGITGTKPS